MGGAGFAHLGGRNGAVRGGFALYIHNVSWFHILCKVLYYMDICDGIIIMSTTMTAYTEVHLCGAWLDS